MKYRELAEGLSKSTYRERGNHKIAVTVTNDLLTSILLTHHAVQKREIAVKMLEDPGVVKLVLKGLDHAIAELVPHVIADDFREVGFYADEVEDGGDAYIGRVAATVAVQLRGEYGVD